MSLFRFILTCAHPGHFVVVHDGHTVIDAIGRDNALEKVNASFYRDHEVFRWMVINDRCTIWVA